MSAGGWRRVSAALPSCAIALACTACDGPAPEPTGQADAGPPEPVCGVGPLEEFGFCPHPIEVPGAEPWPITLCPELPRGTSGESLLVGPFHCMFTDDMFAAGQDCTPVGPYSECIEDVPAAFGGRGRYPDYDGDTTQTWVEVTENAEGGVDVVWTATELDPATEEAIGVPIEGQLSLGICCEVTFDIYFPTYEFTERVRLQTDWEIKP